MLIWLFIAPVRCVCVSGFMILMRWMNTLDGGRNTKAELLFHNFILGCVCEKQHRICLFYNIIICICKIAGFFLIQRIAFCLFQLISTSFTSNPLVNVLFKPQIFTAKTYLNSIYKQSILIIFILNQPLRFFSSCKFAPSWNC